jgi:iron complex outermembrane receptor protein
MTRRNAFAFARRALQCTVAASALFAGSAFAQTAIPAPEPSEELAAAPVEADAPAEEETSENENIVVTGTSIRGVAPVGAPVLGFNQADIQNQPSTTTTELLRQVPAVVATGASDQFSGAANNANANITGGNGINLRGLGTEATLTLLNGRRLPPAGTQGQFFDPSIIPTSAIGRLEVMADGGSAIYGSDAVGGVVNILLRRRFSGAEVYTSYGLTDDGEAENWIVGGVFGHVWGSGGIMVAYEHNDRQPLAAASRAQYTDDLRPYGGTDLRLFTSNPGNIMVGATRYAIPANQNGVGLTPGQLVAGTANRESAYLGADAIAGQNRDSVIGNIHQDVAPGFRVWVEGYYADRRLDRTVGAATANLTVPRANPFFVHPTNPAATSVTVNYSFFDDYGPRVQDAFQRAWQIAAGFDVELGERWNLTGYGSYGRNHEERSNPAVNNAQLAAALRDPNPATAFNPFGDGSFTNPATLARILGYSAIGAEYSLYDFGAKLDGSLFALPGGDVRIAVGAEYQDHHLLSYFRDNTTTADLNTVSYRPSTTAREVASGYVEAFVPIVGSGNARPGIQELSLSAALRYDDYSDFGGTWNPKFALSYVPVEGLTFRGTFGTSFRAPTLSDIDTQALTITISDFVDPSSPTGVTRTLWVRGGNDSLGPERATIWSLGADYEPAFIPGLNLSLTYFNVKYRDRIETPGNDVLALTPAREPLLGDLVVRNPSAALVNSFLSLPQFTGVPENPANIRAFVDGRKVNVGRLETDGLEANFRYRTDTGFGAINAGLSATYLFNFKRAIAPGSAPVEVVDTISNPQRFRARAYVGATSGGFTGTAYVNYTDDYRNNSVTPVQSVDAHTVVDLSLRYRIETPGMLSVRDITFSLDVQNLFDADPPVAFNGALAFDPQAASILGRYITFGVRASW